MKRRDPLLTESYDYRLPEELIAHSPAEPRESAGLLVYERKTQKITHTTVGRLPEFIPKGCHIFLNDTKVIKARLFGHKKSGGKIELLLNSPLREGRFLVYIRGKVRPGMRLFFEEGLEAEVLALHEEGTRVVTFFQNEKRLDFEALQMILDRIGHMPLPPYIKRSDTEKDLQDYQPLFAREAGAVAAPTASLHFTPSLFGRLQKHFPLHYITLHVGAGTFKPVESSRIEAHIMHKEHFNIPPKSAEILESDAQILAVGTTVTRTIEYYVRTKERSGEADIFLHPLNPPRRVNHLLTNFHLPKSTLLMLVASFVGLEKTLELYAEAIRQKYRFYSYGDAMLIL